MTLSVEYSVLYSNKAKFIHTYLTLTSIKILVKLPFTIKKERGWRLIHSKNNKALRLLALQFPNHHTCVLCLYLQQIFLNNVYLMVVLYFTPSELFVFTCFKTVHLNPHIFLYLKFDKKSAYY